jgi:glyoxylase-like metal-dependent hydrolase (beta-lactamase superfamily II)
MAGNVSITPLALGWFTLPGAQIAKYPGVTIRAPYVVCAYLVRHPQGTMLFDTGIVGDQGSVERYRPHRFDIEEQLGAVGTALSDIDVIANCHLHADHAGGNFRFPGVPILVQELEIDAAGEADYTVREAVIEFEGSTIRPVSGRTEVLPGIWLLPTPGHSPGHQSLLVGNTGQGTVLLAGQAFDSASEFALAALARQVGAESEEFTSPDWMEDLLASGLDVALFAHDLAQWRPGSPPFTGSRPVQPWPVS